MRMIQVSACHNTITVLYQEFKGFMVLTCRKSSIRRYIVLEKETPVSEYR